MGNFLEYLKTRWWGQLICALFFWALAAWDYWDIGRQEREYGYVSLHFVEWMIYSKLGKWGCVCFWGFFGALFTFVGVWNLVVRVVTGKRENE